MENIAELYIGRFKTSMQCTDENEKKILEEITAEANKEFNKLLISFGRLDEKMLLFFMLLSLQMQIESANGKKENFTKTFSSVLTFIKPTVNIEKQLIFGIVYKKNELRKVLKSGSKEINEEQIFTERFNAFVEKAANKIKEIAEIDV